jgi:hypothetical protein
VRVGRVAPVADDDWRVTLTLPDEGHVQRVTQAVHEHEVEQDVRHRLGQRIAVSADGPHVFLYAGTEAAAREAERVVRGVLEQHKLTAEFALDRWHPIEQEWEDASNPLPQTAEQQEAERQRRVNDDTQESLATGKADWEVRVALSSRHEAVELARRLEGEGYQVLRRWQFVAVGANNEDEAAALAQTLKQEAPAGASVDSGPVPFAPFALARLGGVPLAKDL